MLKRLLSSQFFLAVAIAVLLAFVFWISQFTMRHLVGQLFIDHPLITEILRDTALAALAVVAYLIVRVTISKKGHEIEDTLKQSVNELGNNLSDKLDMVITEIKIRRESNINHTLLLDQSLRGVDQEYRRETDSSKSGGSLR